jgi:hypothetical protein
VKRLRYRIAYWLRLLAYKIEPPHAWNGETLADLISKIEPQDTPALDRKVNRGFLG